MIRCQQVEFLEQMCYNIYATNAAGQRPVATQKNISYYYLSPSGFLPHWSRFVTGNLEGLYFWGRNIMGSKHKTTEWFIQRARQMHGDKYSYLETQYIESRGKVVIICPEHGRFEQEPASHLRGSGCPECGGRVQKLSDDYRKLAKKRGFIWLGPEVDKAKIKTEWQCQNKHRWMAGFFTIQQGTGCPYCAGKAPKSVKDYHDLAKKRGFIWMGPEVNKVRIKTMWQCQKGHKWEAAFNGIKTGNGCPYCAVISTEDYHNLATERGFTWLGPEVPNTVTKTKWQCQKGHIWETKFSYIQTGTGCPICHQSRGEKAITSFLNDYGIIYSRQQRFDECRDKRPLPFDFYFYLNQSHFLVEYDGIQHFEPMSFGDDKLENIQRRDIIKTKFAHDNNFILIRIHYTVKSIGVYLQFELEKHLSFSLDQLKNQPERPQPKIKPINPYQWKQGVLL